MDWFVKEHQFLFETLWKKAIPLKQRGKEIEEGQKREFIDTIRETDEVLRILFRIINSAYEEIVILIPNFNVYRAFKLTGIFNKVTEIINKNKKIQVKILFKLGQEEKKEYLNLDNEDTRRTNSNHRLEPNEPSNMLIKYAKYNQIFPNTALVIVDGDKMITFDLEETNLSNAEMSDFMKMATHTNSESMLLSYTSIFEKLWIEAC